MGYSIIQAQNSIRCSSAVIVLLCLSFCAREACYAECSFAHRTQDQSQLNSREHVRHFRFLGQWNYERGEIKYAAWNAHLSPQSCDGPNCQADGPTPDSQSIAPSRNLRDNNPVLAVLLDGGRTCPLPSAASLALHEFPITLYQSVPLKPPR